MEVRIVCAANMHEDGRIVLGIRHWDTIMRATVKAMNDGKWDTSWSRAAQGFVDQYGTWYDREAALEIAKTNGQLRGEKCTPTYELFSEDLY